MIQTLPETQLVTFEEFIKWKPEGKFYELHDGEIIEMNPPLGKHERRTGFLSRKLTVEFDRLNLPYFIPKQALVKQRTGESAYSPDVLLIDPTNLVNEPLWEKTSTVTQGDSVPLVIEVVSTNWRVDYYRKYSDYEEMGIKEYWIVDYQPFGAAKFVGEPKQPTISVCSLVGDEYEMNQFRNDDQIISHIFPELNLTANQILLTAN
ncbi:Uma2 family endonuclease [Dolichospermum sp. ST_con]|nr:Uma2 family endonuclease [Dolichospermum sp. ST_con]MDD1418650.1 Uma2 family endonuclease [Dolichospermum sp. ST_sed1]MDD1424305.1 Uma2 family endonuclease [Dolichospermum sp. ST_sed9]MDD1430780.1 Uma2 family endonuclease [Dolichospermum sp. ST_sed6]MDD1436386.1 Uma2 family endonuclease [Dolichospermum sp. ST_sed10]MDD1440068.1 Uma2 family endonuclease [Dolichospermum sp. ST_sed3]MDD1445780.1 Uma2 family endonuclease [Dolichospermum sp. ST_sed8]MDD1454217.1 Uma2 family endonuclease [Dolic